MQIISSQKILSKNEKGEMPLASCAFVWLKDAWLAVIPADFVGKLYTRSAGMLASVDEMGFLSIYLFLACSFCII